MVSLAYHGFDRRGAHLLLAAVGLARFLQWGSCGEGYLYPQGPVESGLGSRIPTGSFWAHRG